MIGNVRYSHTVQGNLQQGADSFSVAKATEYARSIIVLIIKGDCQIDD